MTMDIIIDIILISLSIDCKQNPSHPAQMVESILLRCHAWKRWGPPMGGREAAAVQCSLSMLVEPAPTTFAHQGWSHTGLQVPTPGPSSPLHQPGHPPAPQGPGRYAVDWHILCRPIHTLSLYTLCKGRVLPMHSSSLTTIAAGPILSAAPSTLPGAP